MGSCGRVSPGVVCALSALSALMGLVGTESDCQSAKKSARKALEAPKGLGGGGNRSPVRRKKLRTKRTKGLRVSESHRDAPENARDMRDMRGKGLIGVECAP
jgi:hypothetical protein